MIEPQPVSSSCNIVLIGYRGTGKTTVGRILAKELGWQFFDADVLIEERAGCSIAEIFERYGEARFRDLESEVLTELLSGQFRVISTGGGAILRAENRQQIRAAGYVAWLTATIETLWARLQGDPTTKDRRPNLTTGGREEIANLLSLREPLYRETASKEFSTEGRSPEALAADILGEWKSCSNSP